MKGITYLVYSVLFLLFGYFYSVKNRTIFHTIRNDDTFMSDVCRFGTYALKMLDE